MCFVPLRCTSTDNHSFKKWDQLVLRYPAEESVQFLIKNFFTDYFSLLQHAVSNNFSQTLFSHLPPFVCVMLSHWMTQVAHIFENSYAAQIAVCYFSLSLLLLLSLFQIAQCSTVHIFDSVWFIAKCVSYRQTLSKHNHNLLLLDMLTDCVSSQKSWKEILWLNVWHDLISFGENCCGSFCVCKNKVVRICGYYTESQLTCTELNSGDGWAAVHNIQNECVCIQHWNLNYLSELYVCHNIRKKILQPL